MPSRQDSNSPPRLIAYPRLGVAYTECLYAAVAKLGVDVVDGNWSGQWLASTVRRNDIIHMHWPSFFYYDSRSRLRTWTNLARFIALMTLIRRRGVRIVWTAHNLYPHDGGRTCWSHRAARKYMTRVAERIFVHGATAAKIFGQEFAGTGAKLVQIPHGNFIEYYPPPTARNESRTRLGLPSEGFVYGFVGTCKPYKNLDALLETFSRLEGNCSLLIAGHFQSAEYLAHIRDLIARMDGARVRFEPRFLSHEEVPLYMSATDALIVPYTEILTSGSAMLGLSFGRPIVAPNIGGLPDVIDPSCGLLYDAHAPDSLMNALVQIRQRRFEVEKILGRAREFEWRAAAEPLVDLLRR
jgi:glycosyltransferase involved in cell wall biosynthesis